MQAGGGGGGNRTNVPRIGSGPHHVFGLNMRTAGLAELHMCVVCSECGCAYDVIVRSSGSVCSSGCVYMS